MIVVVGFVVVIVVVGRGNFFVEPPEALVAQSCNNNLGRSSKVGTTFPK